MKKMLMIALALGLAVALAAPATATDWSASGYIYVLGAVHKTMPSGGPVPNPDPTSPPYFGDAWNDTWSWVRMGAGLNITARQSEDLYGVLGFRMHSSRWGEPDLVGADPSEMAAWYRAETTGTLSVLLNHAYIDFRVPPKLPIWMRVGVQPIFVRPWVFVMWDGPGISLRIPIDPIKLTITPAWYKKWEGADFEGDDNDVYTVDMNMPIGPVSIGSFFWYENYNDWSRANGFLAVVDDSGSRNEADLWYIGVYSNGKLGPVSYMLDFVYGGGEIDGNPAATVPVADRDIESWVIRGETSVNISKFTVGLGALYATGEDNSTVDSEQYIAPNQREGGLNGHAPLQDFLLLTDGFLGMIPARGNMAGYIGGPNPLGGVWYVRGFAQVMLTDWMRVGVNMGWIGDTTDDGNRIGNAQDAAGNLRDDDDIGFEIDVGANIQLYKNLQWGIGFGYLVAGDAMDMNTGVVGVNEAPQDPWVLCTALLYTF